MATGVVATPLAVHTTIDYGTVVAAVAAFFVLCIELLHLVFGYRFPFWTRQLERVRRPEERFSWASIGFLLMLIVLFWLVPLPVACAAAAMLAFGDGFSALVGRAVGRRRIRWNPVKSWEGSIAGFVAGGFGSYIIVQWYASGVGASYSTGPLVVVLLLGAAAATMAETLPRMQDNVTMPAAAGLAMAIAWAAFGLQPGAGHWLHVARQLGFL